MPSILNGDRNATAGVGPAPAQGLHDVLQRDFHVEDTGSRHGQGAVCPDVPARPPRLHHDGSCLWFTSPDRARPTRRSGSRPVTPNSGRFV